MDSRKGFSLIELLVVLAILAVVAALIMAAIDPIAKMKMGRDAQRRTEMNGIANALRSYEAVYGKYPDPSVHSETSLGTAASDWVCGTGNGWNAASPIYNGIVSTGGFLKNLPKDPSNVSPYCYIYDPKGPTEAPCTTEGRTCRYYVGVLLEKPVDITKPVFRCSDDGTLALGAGCKEVAAVNPPSQYVGN